MIGVRVLAFERSAKVVEDPAGKVGNDVVTSIFIEATSIGTHRPRRFLAEVMLSRAICCLVAIMPCKTPSLIQPFTV